MGEIWISYSEAPGTLACKQAQSVSQEYSSPYPDFTAAPWAGQGGCRQTVPFILNHRDNQTPWHGPYVGKKWVAVLGSVKYSAATHSCPHSGKGLLFGCIWLKRQHHLVVLRELLRDLAHNTSMSTHPAACREPHSTHTTWNTALVFLLIQYAPALEKICMLEQLDVKHYTPYLNDIT